MNEEKKCCKKKCCCKCDFTEEVKKSSVAVWLFAICGFLFGMIVGIFCAPIKKGVKIGCNNSAVNGRDKSRVNYNSDVFNDYDDEYDDEEEVSF